MSAFPARYEGEDLAPLYEKAVALTSEETVQYYENLFENMCDFYGIIPLREVFRILTEHYNEPLSEEAFLAFCEYERHAQVQFYIFGAEEYDEDCTDPPSAPMDRLLAHEVYVEFENTYTAIMQLKTGKPWFVPPREAFEGRNGYWQDSNAEEAKAIRYFIKKAFNLSNYHAENALSDMSLALSHEDSDFYMVLNELQRYTKKMPVEKVRAFIPYFIPWNNKSRAGFNNGYTPEELEALREEYGFTSDTKYLTELVLDEEKEAIRNAQAIGRLAIFSNVEKTLSLLMQSNPKPQIPQTISRNALCPCGSGKKYKRCCGKDQK